MAVPVFASQPRKASPLTLNLSTLPKLTTMLSPTNEKDVLPCIMITPSTPIHDRDFEIHYFMPEKPQRGLFARISSAFTSTPTHRIALPDYPDEFVHGNSPLPAWPLVRRLRALILLLVAFFIGLHLFVLPNGESGLLDVLQGHHANEAHGTPLVWEGWVEPPIPIGSSASPSPVPDLSPTATARLDEALETVL